MIMTVIINQIIHDFKKSIHDQHDHDQQDDDHDSDHDTK